ncbi:hypothetical protein BU26DRAFT_35917 [Trematosphaeria pertusa]|uniref:BRCT domain-containing protein n=1 Tax=Trematosphaeria pertusa TaxID=390896 RepID=A0A6A6J2L6_9PLEO|nr:uncharacterized protein BU26DRAFT_35917 [Trematosphaeria pertusa]KAF2257084.1 hypothetical protein BU26DRAFT_35917 [Trematosphaeria pertusa]
MPPKTATASISIQPNALAGKKCIITGEIPGQSRKSAEQILINAGATIEKSLNKKVQLVVLGEDAGPKKLEKIEELGVETKEWDELMDEIKGDGGADADTEEDTKEDEETEEEEVEEKPKPKKKKSKLTAKANSKAKAAPAPKPSKNASGSTFLKGKKVIISGTIPGHDRKSAQAIVEKAGANTAKSLNKQVELVILGANPGPDKMTKIEDLGIETITWKELAEKLGIDVAPEKETAKVDVDGHTRQSAQKLLESTGAKFAKSLNKSVELVVLGTKPGPDKLNKISEMGLPTCSWEDLIEKLGLDAEAKEPPKKKAKKAKKA